MKLIEAISYGGTMTAPNGPLTPYDQIVEIPIPASATEGRLLAVVGILGASMYGYVFLDGTIAFNAPDARFTYAREAFCTTVNTGLNGTALGQPIGYELLEDYIPIWNIGAGDSREAIRLNVTLGKEQVYNPSGGDPDNRLNPWIIPGYRKADWRVDILVIDPEVTLVPGDRYHCRAMQLHPYVTDTQKWVRPPLGGVYPDHAEQSFRFVAPLANPISPPVGETIYRGEDTAGISLPWQPAAYYYLGYSRGYSSAHSDESSHIAPTLNAEAQFTYGMSAGEVYHPSVLRSYAEERRYDHVSAYGVSYEDQSDPSRLYWRESFFAASQSAHVCLLNPAYTSVSGTNVTEFSGSVSGITQPSGTELQIELYTRLVGLYVSKAAVHKTYAADMAHLPIGWLLRTVTRRDGGFIPQSLTSYASQFVGDTVLGEDMAPNASVTVAADRRNDSWIWYHTADLTARCYLSRNGGRTWAHWADHAGIAYPCACLLLNTTVLVGLVGSDLKIYTSPDWGKTLTLAHSIPGVAGRPVTLDSDRRDYCHLVYEDGAGTIRHIYSANGRTWSEPDTWNPGRFPRLALAPSGGVFGYFTHAGEFKLYRVNPGGRTLGTPLNAPFSGTPAGVGISHDRWGNVLVAIASETGTSVYLTSNSGADWRAVN